MSSLRSILLGATLICAALAIAPQHSGPTHAPPLTPPPAAAFVTPASDSRPTAHPGPAARQPQGSARRIPRRPNLAKQLPGAKTVARLQLEAPDTLAFILRGTIPLPPGVFPRPDGLIPFGIRDATGQVVPAQLEIVSRYANPSDGADVVQLLARVSRESAVAPGTPIEYEVVEFLHPPAPFTPDPAVAQLVGTPSSLLLVAQDVFGNKYLLDLLAGAGSKRTLRKGQAALQVRTYGTLRPASPISGPQSTLAELLGVHAYVTAYEKETALEVDLRFNNGLIGPDPRNPAPLSPLYFAWIKLLVPKGWTLSQAFPDPFFGASEDLGSSTAYAIVQPNPDGTMHAMEPQAQFVRRLVICPEGAELQGKVILERQGLGFARRGTSAQDQALYSWWNKHTARYFPQRSRVPHYDHIGGSSIRAKKSAQLEALASVMATGGNNGYPVGEDVMGWAHPYWGAYGGMTGGDGIVPYGGHKTLYAASRAGYRLFQLRFRMNTDREPVALYKADGDTVAVEDFLLSDSQGNDYVPFSFFHTAQTTSSKAFFGLNAPPNLQVQAVIDQGKQPAYQEQLFSYMPHDHQHLARMSKDAQVLAWLGNDAVAKDCLAQEAELFRLSYHPYPNNPWGGAQGSGMLKDLLQAASNPGKGISVGRGEAWGTDCVVAAYAVASPEWRAQVRPWIDTLAGLLEQGQAACIGSIRAAIGSKNNLTVQGEVVRGRNFEEILLQSAVLGMLRSVYQNTTSPHQQALATTLDRSLHSLISDVGWSTELKGPWKTLAIGPADLSQALFCTPGSEFHDDAIENWYSWNSFAYGWQLTGDPRFLDRVIEMGGGSVQSLMEKLQSDNYSAQLAQPHQAALLALGQELMGW